ncbi:MAG: zf-HC2 domain-containing protein, partial [Ktedonobacteraceae bacterium]|nr:zf-HC2 domain-containing protein [Ktedonobacteraceae bacterium]
MITQPPCIAWAEKLALRREDLSPADQTALDAHTATCPACRKALEDYHFLSAALKSLPPPVVKPLPRLRLDAEEPAAIAIEESIPDRSAYDRSASSP